MHPFMDNLENYVDENIKEKLTDLTNKYWKTSNPNVQQQIILAIDTLNLEIQRRQSVKNQSTDIKDIDNLINIS
tara:strand:- start:1581 stop:1802 length:222 start_codon:yes stop_codon:yes gene_type:complete